jgi:hypothetical protein
VTAAQEQFESLMQEIEKFLAVEGFHRSGKCFNKRMPDGKVRWSIDSQRSQSTTADRTKFTFWVHAQWKHRPAWHQDWEPKKTWYGGAGGRIGDLMPNSQDTWWEITDKTSIKSLGGQINTVFNSCVLPFLRQFQTETEIKNYLRACANDTMRRNYPHALTMLAFDLLEMKPQSEIKKSVENVRRLGKINLVSKPDVEEAVQRVLKTYGNEELHRRLLPFSHAKNYP